MICKNCNNEIKEGSKFCGHCGASVEMFKKKDSFTSNNSKCFDNNSIVKFGKLRILTWFLMTNATVILSIVLISGGLLISYIPIFFGIGTIFRFIPVFGFVYKFVCGVNGNDWLWKTGKQIVWKLE